MFLPVSVALRVLQLELAKTALRSTEDVLHRHDLQGDSVGGRLVHRVLGALERSRLLDYDEEEQDNEDVEEDYETHVPCKWPTLAYQLLLVPFSLLLEKSFIDSISVLSQHTHRTVDLAITDLGLTDHFI